MKLRIFLIYFFFALFVEIIQAKDKPLRIFNETYEFQIRWGFLHVGNVKMKTQTKKNSPLLKIHAQVTPFEKLKYVYYIEGNFGGLWNYVTSKPFAAFEEIYQGKKYQKRYFRFKDKKAFLKITEKKFSEHRFPHKGPSRITKDKESHIDAQGYQDLLGAFYYIRTLKNKPKKNDVFRIKVLPAGSRKILILKVLNVFTSKEVPFFGTRKIMHIKSALASPDSNKTEKGGNLFLNTKSQINMWITYDDDYVPVKIWSSLEYIGELQILLNDYRQR